MNARSLVGTLSAALLFLPLTSCGTSPALTSITIIPSSVTTSMTNGLQVDFTAIGNYTRPNHAAVTKDITDSVSWASSFPQFVVINASGVATVTGYGYGVGNINASTSGFHGTIVGSASFTIQQPTTTTGAIVSLSILPAGKSSGAVQFTAVGKLEDGTMVRLSGQPKWISTDSEIASIDPKTGLATELGLGRTTITAVYTNPDGTTAVGKTTFNVASEN